MKSFIIKSALEVLNLIFNNRLFYAFCRKFGLIRSVFCVYPASEKYADYFTFRWRQAIIKWTPFIIGAAKQEGGWTLMYAASATESEITSEAQGDNLYWLNERLERIARQAGAKSTHFAGILPSFMRQRGIHRDQIERRVTVDAVLKAVRVLDPEHEIKKVILLGSHGYIGARVVEKLKSAYSVIGVEKGEKYIPPQERHLVINISVPYAIREHLRSFNEGTVILNEVYPAPHKMLLKEIKDRGAEIHHIVGIRAKMYPSLSGDYDGAMPCCGSLEDQGNEVILKKM